MKKSVVVYLLLIACWLTPTVVAASDLYVAPYSISARSLNPNYQVGELFAPDPAQIQVDVTNYGAAATGVDIGFYNIDDGGAQIGETQTVNVEEYGSAFVSSGYNLNTAAFAGQTIEIKVVVYHSGEVYPDDNTASQFFSIISAGALGSISGNVSTTLGFPVPGACIQAYGLEGGGNGFADAQGDFVVSNLAPGRYTVFMDIEQDSPYVRTWRTSIPVYGNQTTADVNLITDTNPADSGAIAVQVLDEYGWPADLSEHGQTALSLFTRLYDPLTNEEGWVTLGSQSPVDGYCYFNNIPLGMEVNLSLQQPYINAGYGLEPYSTEFRGPITVSPGLRELEPIQTYPAGQIQGMVVDLATGAPVSGVDVQAARVTGNTAEHGYSENVESDEDGLFQLEHLRSGEYRIMVENGQGYAQTVVTDLAVDVGEVTTTTVALSPGAEVSGTVTNLSQLLQMTGFFPGPNQEIGVAALNRLNPDEYSYIKNNVGSRVLEEVVLAGVSTNIDLQTGEFSFAYSYPPTGSYYLVPFLYWKNDQGGFVVASFGTQEVASPGTGNSTSGINLTANTSIGKLTGAVYPGTDMVPEEVAVWLIPESEDNPLAGYANAYYDRASGLLKYEIPFVPVGTYNVYAACPGFDTISYGGVRILQGATRTQDITFTADVSAPDNPSLPASGGFSIDYEDDDLLLNWTASAAPDLGGYNIYRGDDGAPFTRRGFAPARATSYSEFGMDTPGLTYRWKITAIDNAGNESDSGTADVWAVTLFDTFVSLFSPDDMSTVTETDQGNIHFSWGDVTAADTYHVIVESMDGENLVDADVSDTRGYFYAGSTALTAGEDYLWQVYAWNSSETGVTGSGEYSFTYQPSYSGMIEAQMATDTGQLLAGEYAYLLSGNGNFVDSLMTSDTGYVLKEGLPDGNYVLQGEALGWSAQISDVLTISGGSADTTVLCLPSATGGITGYVFDLAGNPLDQVEVMALQTVPGLSEEEGGWFWVAWDESDVDGYFDLTGLVAGQSYTLSIYGYSDANNVEYSSIWDPNSFAGDYKEYVLSPAALVSGTITDSSTGRPLADIPIRFESDDYGEYSISDTYGRYWVNLVPGSYQVTANEDNGGASDGAYGIRRLSGRTVGFGNNTVNVQLPPGGAIAGTVDTGGYVFSGSIMVAAFPAGTSLTAIDAIEGNLNPASSIFVDPDGSYTMTGIPGGSYDVYAVLYSESPFAHGDYGEDTTALVGLLAPQAALAVTAGQTTAGIDFTLASSGNAIRGNLVTGGGDSIAVGYDELAAVILNRQDGTFQALYSMEDLEPSTARNYVLEGVPSGTYELLGYADGYETVSYPLTVSADTVVNLVFTDDVTPPATPAWSGNGLVPAFSDSHYIELQWNEDEDADRYMVYRWGPTDTQFVLLSSNIHPAAKYSDGDSVAFTDYSLSDVDTTGYYRYLIRAVDLAGNVSDSSAIADINLITKTHASTDTSVQPVLAASGEVNTLTPTFNWAASTGAVKYWLLLASEQEVLYAGSVDTPATTLQYPGTPKLYPGRTYYWAVQATTAVDTSWSRTAWRAFRINTDLAPPQITHTPIYSASSELGLTARAYIFAPGGGVNSAQLLFGQSGSFATINMTADTAVPGAYQATIASDSISDGWEGFYYKIVAKSGGGSTQSPRGTVGQWDISEAYYVAVTDLVSVSGFVYELGTHNPVVGAQLLAMPDDTGAMPVMVYTAADQTGYFSLDLIPGMKYALNAQQHGYLPVLAESIFADSDKLIPPYSYAVDLTAGVDPPAPGEITCYLSPHAGNAADSGILSGMVVDEQGNPVAGAIVVVDRDDTPDMVRADYGVAITDPGGRYWIPNVQDHVAYALYGQVNNRLDGSILMQGMVDGNVDYVADTFTSIIPGGEKALPSLIMRVGFADDEAPLLSGIVDSGPDWVTLAVSEKLSHEVYNRNYYSLGETAPLAAADTPVSIAHISYDPDNNRVTLETQWKLGDDVSGVTSYELRIDSGITDWAGNPMSDTVIYFDFSAGADYDSPQMVSAMALEGDSTGGKIALFFSEAITASALTWQSVDNGLTLTAYEGYLQPNAVVYATTPMVDGQLYTLTADDPTNPKDYGDNSLVGDTQVTFYGMNSGVIDEVHLVAVSLAAGQPQIDYGAYLLITNDLDSHAQVASLRDPAGMMVSLTECDPDKLPAIVHNTGSGMYAAVVRVDSQTVSADTVLAVYGGGLITVSSCTPPSGYYESTFVNVNDTATGYRYGVVTGSVSDTALIVAELPDYRGELYAPAELSSTKGYIAAGETFTIYINENAVAELTAVRLSDLQTATRYDIQVVPGETVSVGQIVFPATTDTFGMITGILDKPDTGPSLIYYTPSGERSGWVEISARAAGSDEHAGKPINPDADFVTLANGDLKYTIWGIPVAAGDTVTYIIDVYAYGYQPVSQSVDLNYNRKDRSNVDFSLKLAGSGRIRGQVTNMVGIPVSDVEVFAGAGQYGDEQQQATFTNDRGFFEIPYLAPGDYTVAAEPEGTSYIAGNAYLRLDTGATAYANFRLMPGSTIRGQLWNNADSSPVSGVRIEAVPMLGGMEEEVLEAASNLDGKFTIFGVPRLNGLTYRLSFERPGYDAVYLVGLAPGDTTISVGMTATNSQTAIAGRVASNDTWLVGANVTAFSQSSANVTFAGQSNSSGTYTLTALPAGYYRVEVFQQGYRRAVIQNVAVVTGQTTVLDEQVLEEGASLSGRVTSAAGAGVANAVVRAVSTESLDWYGSATTNSNGYYSIVGLVKNTTYRVVVIQNSGADIFPYSKTVFLTADATANIQITDFAPQFLVDCQRGEADSTTFQLTITASERLTTPPLLSVLQGSGYFTAGGSNDSTAIKQYDRVYRISYTEPDTTATVERLLITGTDLQNNTGSGTYVFQPLYEKTQEVLLNVSQTGQYTLDNGAGVIVPSGAYNNVNDTSGDAARSSVRIRIAQINLQSSTGGETQAPQYYGAPQYMARYAPPASGTGQWSRASNDYDIHMSNGAGETIAVADGKWLTITIPYDPTKIADTEAARIHLYYYNETLGRWVGEVTSQAVNTENHTVTIGVNHLSKFAAFKDPDVVGDQSGDQAVDDNDLVIFNVNYADYQNDSVSGYSATSDISGPSGVADGAIDFEDAAKLGQEYGN